MIRYFGLMWLVLLFLAPTAFASDPASLMVINQIRGEEKCCQPGNLKMVEGIQANPTFKDLKINWALRFDTLENEPFTQRFSQQNGIGLLLEITPSLASASGVMYKGDFQGSDWYYAKNAFLVGYTQEERKKIIDTAFFKFKKTFNYYPVFTVSWMIDSWSLKYLSSQYKVKIHEITKEQYETDSYTLSGGIFNVPYYPSKLHPLIPGKSVDSLNLIILRQTVSDPIKNYGSAKAFFTSQPNDYLSNSQKSDFSYFQELITSALERKSAMPFALLGFENSFDWDKFGSEFEKQLTWIVDLKNQARINDYYADEFSDYYRSVYRNNSSFFFQEDFSPGNNLGVLWYFGNNYRARILKMNDKIILDDLRNFSPIIDPYYELPSKADNAYQIVPYLFDGSGQYNISKSQEKNLKKLGLYFGTSYPDYLVDPYGIVLGKGTFNLTQEGESLIIRFDNSDYGQIRIQPENIEISRNNNVSFFLGKEYGLEQIFDSTQDASFIIPRNPQMYFKNNIDYLNLGWRIENDFIDLFRIYRLKDVYQLSPNKTISNIQILAPIFQPDRSSSKINVKNSILYWNNMIAITGRNPIRLFILPLDDFQRPVKVERLNVVSDKTDKLKITYPQDYSYKINPWFIDINSDISQAAKIYVMVDQEELVNGQIVEFITDCRINFVKCLTNPLQLVKYLTQIALEQKNALFKK